MADFTQQTKKSCQKAHEGYHNISSKERASYIFTKKGEFRRVPILINSGRRKDNRKLEHKTINKQIIEILDIHHIEFMNYSFVDDTGNIDHHVTIIKKSKDKIPFEDSNFFRSEVLPYSQQFVQFGKDFTLPQPQQSNFFFSNIFYFGLLVYNLQN